MTRAIAVLRPEPGNAATAAAIEAAGGRALRLPLFRVAPVAWQPPDAARYDALLLTSANAVRHAGVLPPALAALPVLAVGDATARAARDAGLTVTQVGAGGAAALAQSVDAGTRVLRLAGRERTALAGIDTITVYAADPLSGIDAAALAGSVAMLHSARAARHLAALIPPAGRAGIAIAAISAAVCDAAGGGWQRAESTDTPDDARLVPLALHLAD